MVDAHSPWDWTGDEITVRYCSLALAEWVAQLQAGSIALSLVEEATVFPIVEAEGHVNGTVDAED